LELSFCLTEFLLPVKERPQTNAMTARRLLCSSLGVTQNISREQRQREREQLKEAKGKIMAEQQSRGCGAVDGWATGLGVGNRIGPYRWANHEQFNR